MFLASDINIEGQKVFIYPTDIRKIIYITSVISMTMNSVKKNKVFPEVEPVKNNPDRVTKMDNTAEEL